MLNIHPRTFITTFEGKNRKRRDGKMSIFGSNFCKKNSIQIFHKLFFQIIFSNKKNIFFLQERFAQYIFVSQLVLL